MLVDERVLRRAEDGAWVLERELDEIDLPVSLNALLGARLDRLDTQTRGALERGAVEGELFHRGAVVELSHESLRPAVPGELEELAGKDLIRPAAASLAGEVAYRFKHILVREAAYRATAKKLRALLHERFADWLERLAGERVGEYQEILGYHFEQSYRYRLELGPVDEDGQRLAVRGGPSPRRRRQAGDRPRRRLRRREPARPGRPAPAARQPRAARADASVRIRDRRVRAHPRGLGDLGRGARAGNGSRRAWPRGDCALPARWSRAPCRSERRPR